MGDAISVVDRAVNRINHPAQIRLRRTGQALLAQQPRFGKSAQQNGADKFLAPHIQVQLDVVAGLGIDFLGDSLIAPHQATGQPRRPDRGSQGFLLIAWFHSPPGAVCLAGSSNSSRRALSRPEISNATWRTVRLVSKATLAIFAALS